MWFRRSRYPFTFLRFTLSLLAGATSFFPALLLQNLFIAGKGGFTVTAGKWGLLGDLVRIALTEEVSRLLLLLVLFLLFRRFGSGGSGDTAAADAGTPAPANTSAQAGTSAPMGAAGLVAGLGFAILENAVYGASNPGIVLLRMFTATLLHGACGSRVGFALAMFPQKPARAVLRFLTAVVIHGVYNFMLETPGWLPTAAAILIAVSALASSVLTIRTEMKQNKGNPATLTSA
jgi:RsiW-degrading membrane proteinase PrsW (M82 family)